MFFSCCCGWKKYDYSGDVLLFIGKKGDEWEIFKYSVCKFINVYGELEF